MNKQENGKLIEIAEAIARLEVDMKYVKEHITVINGELGVCILRLNKLEENVRTKRAEWKLLTAVAGGTASIVTFIYWLLRVSGVIKI